MDEYQQNIEQETLKMARRIVNEFLSLPEVEVRLLADIIEKRTAKKGEVFIKEGQVCDSIIYVTQGIARQFYYKNGVDITEHFTSEGQFLYCIESMYLQKPTSLMAEALEPLTYYKMNYLKLKELTRKSIGIAQWYIKLLEFDGLVSQEKADVMRFESASERYEHFLKYYPEAARRASSQHIASYLVMTRESLSRVRAGKL